MMPKREKPNIPCARIYEIASTLEDLGVKKNDRNICLEVIRVLNTGDYEL